MNQTAVLLIDMQPYFLDKISAAAREIIICEQTKLLQDCARLKVPLIVLEMWPKDFETYEKNPCGETVDVLQREVSKVAKARVIIKPGDNGFQDTELGSMTQELRIRRAVVTGINASMCVYKTALGAVYRKIDVFTSDRLIADCDCRSCQRLNKKREWYEKNTTFFDQPTSLETFLGSASRV